MPTVRRVMGGDRVIPTPPTLAYDDASEFVNPIGGTYLSLCEQDVEVVDGTLVPREAGRGFWFNHSPNFCWNDFNLLNRVWLHSHVTHDFLTGEI